MPADFAKVKDVFLAALEQPLPGRAAFLDVACADNAALRQQVEVMLRTHEQSGELLSRTPAEMLREDSEAGATAALGDPAPAAATDDLSFLEAATRPGALGRLRH